MSIEKQIIHTRHFFSTFLQFLFAFCIYVHSVLVSHTPSYSLHLTLCVSRDTEFDHCGNKTLGVVSCVKNGREIGSPLPLQWFIAEVCLACLLNFQGKDSLWHGRRAWSQQVTERYVISKHAISSMSHFSRKDESLHPLL